MKRIYLLFFPLLVLLGLFPNRATAQNPPPQVVRVVDGVNAPAVRQYPGDPYHSITAALATPPPGGWDGLKIYVRSMKYQGVPVGYSETPDQNWRPQGEIFPIVIPPGVIIEGENPNETVVWTESGATSALFEVQCASPGESGRTLSSLVLVGGQAGLKVDCPSGSDTAVTAYRVRFNKNGIGALDEAIGGELSGLVLDTCWVTDETPVVPSGSPVPAPALQTQDVGISLHAKEGDSFDRGFIHARFLNLRTLGDFQAVAGAPSSRLVQILAEGKNIESATGGTTRVEAEFEGGDLNGRTTGSANSSAGWKVGIHALTNPQPHTSVHDSVNSYDVSLSGTVVENFSDTGIVGQVVHDSMGLLHLQGSTIVKDVGEGIQPGGIQDAGIYLHAEEGYLGILGSQSAVRNNAGTGIYLEATNSDPNPAMQRPVGLYTELESCEVSYNGLDGMTFYADSGAVGSAYVLDGTGNNSRKLFSSHGFATDPPFGQGVVDRSLIHNNGDQGVDLTTTDNPWSLAGCRFTNTFFWNQPMEAYHASVGANSYLLSPLVHCTALANGDQANATVEIVAPNGSPVFRWDEQDPVSGQWYYPWTKIWNSVLVRSNPNNPDLGLGLQGLLLLDPGSAGAPITVYQSFDKVYVRGLRCLPSYGETIPLWYTSVSPPFVGPVTAATLLAGDPSPFFLDSGSATFSNFDQTPDYLQPLHAPEVGVDYLGYPRPPLGQADKGAQTN